LEALPSRQWNGRQIKNAFQPAIALAYWDFNSLLEDSRPTRPVLRAKHFKRVGQTSAHFDDYIGSVYGIEEQDIYSVLAAREEVRRDTSPLTSFMNSKDDGSLYGTREKKSPLHRTLHGNFRALATGRKGKVDKGDDYDDEDDDDDEEDKVGENDEQDDTDDMEYQRELAKLKRKYKQRGSL
jgi:hypothetical protein